MNDPVANLAAIFSPEPEENTISPVEGISDTDWMDGIRTLEDKADQYKVYAQCMNCFEWTFIEGSAETHGEYTRGRACRECGGKLDPTSVISKRTYRPEIAKRRRPKGVRRK